MQDRLHLYLIGGLFVAAAVVLSVVTLMPQADSNPPKVPRVRPDQPVELGDVRWRRDFHASLDEARRLERPVLVLFDEVPGCSTVVGYGRSVLSHPLVVEAAESLFVPVVVYNNVEGMDREVLRAFDEPTWNNPVVRLIDADRKALAPRLDGDYTVGGLATHMTRALGEAHEPVPQWLALLAEQEKAERDGTEIATFGMYCFWSGEAGFGKLDGVVSTRTGFLGGREVVQVEYDPRTLPYEKLATWAKDSRTGEVVFSHGDRQHTVAKKVFADRATAAEGAMRPSPSDDKYSLARTPWAFVPMTEAQASRANALLAAGRSPADLFSPRQRALYELAEAHPDAGWPRQLGAGDLIEAFARTEAVAARVREAKKR